MDRAIFEFNSEEYTENEVSSFSRKVCEKLADVDDENVTKYNIETNDDLIECFYDHLNNDNPIRVFVIDEENEDND